MLDKWISIKSAYRVVLEDNTELILSGDHRLLTNRGFKHVQNTIPASAIDRISPVNRLVGTGAFAPQPVHDREYRRGYVCGMVRGDGNLAHYSYSRAGRSTDDVYRFRLALCDLEALERSQPFLETLAAPTTRSAFAHASESRRAATALRTESARTTSGSAN